MSNFQVGIVGYGVYVPKYYLDPREIDEKASSLGLNKKSLAAWDEDSVTMAVEAGRIALQTAQVKANELGAVYVGSESPPYAVNPSSTIVADVLGVGKDYRAVDLQFACKAATAGMQMAMGEVAGKHHNYGLVVGTDKAQARRGDVLEWAAGAAAAAVVIGKDRVLARMLTSVSVTSDTPDFWRRERQRYPIHAGRFSGEPAYYSHITDASRQAMNKMKITPKELTYAVFHMPNGRYPREVARQLGFNPAQYEPTMTVIEVGNPYSASALLGLVAVLEILQPGERVLVTAYGSGAGADAIILEGTGYLLKRKWGGLQRMFKHRRQISLLQYKQRERWD